MKSFLILLLCISSALFVQVINCIILNDISVPDLVKIEKSDDDTEIEPIPLDCDYELDENPSYLVVKWFVNNNTIYQWIRGQKPSVLPYFKHHIGDSEPISIDENYKYRGLTLINPSIELSGTYKCLVQTDRDSKAMEKELHVVDISNHSIAFDHYPVQNETYLECSVTNIFPKPRIHLESNDEHIMVTNNETRVVKLDNNYYNVTITAVAQNLDEDADLFECHITFDGLSLNLTASAVRSGVCRRNSLNYGLFASLIVMSFATKLLNLF